MFEKVNSCIDAYILGRILVDGNIISFDTISISDDNNWLYEVLVNKYEHIGILKTKSYVHICSEPCVKNIQTLLGISNTDRRMQFVQS